ncbi:diacylglycerol kinase family protein [Acetilactobacillus jinshanensis]|uniref:Diacylglycerol kinase family protein n=1 Tax=Acetilactobacillus jinshanensis TaxID=1720083 RepID=A0A4P6ZKA5_9LACO|nr:diacylglycerol kinase family protein [Acetilactobacillus jinshanensis]QBP17983.1 diacylglycerol kinase family protein [Acetilactobacillus jinshanensis]URL60845.1 diacylglycerol kinase family protein [uncultured bacterium]
MASQNDHQITKNKNFCQSLGHAWDGIIDLFKEERNFRFHTCAAMTVVVIGLILHVSLEDWSWLLVAIFAVLVMEGVNTVVENMVDLEVGHHYNLRAKHIKDIAAGCVLVTSFFAAIIGCIVFIPVLLRLV